MDRDLWTVAEAKAKLSEVIERAQKEGPQVITRNGRKRIPFTIETGMIY